jgi:hypothetical protein
MNGNDSSLKDKRVIATDAIIEEDIRDGSSYVA